MYAVLSRAHFVCDIAHVCHNARITKIAGRRALRPVSKSKFKVKVFHDFFGGIDGLLY
jgi:hypothetical protein